MGIGDWKSSFLYSQRSGALTYRGYMEELNIEKPCMQRLHVLLITGRRLYGDKSESEFTELQPSPVGYIKTKAKSKKLNHVC